MKINIVNVKIHEFKCFDELNFELFDRTVISGDNESGKSTVNDAIAYVFTGKNSLSESSFSIVPYGKWGKVSPSVELECEIVEDGKSRPLTLKREYKANHSRDGNFTDYKTVTQNNGKDTGVRAFDEYIKENIAKPDVWRLLVNPKYFTEDMVCKPGTPKWQIQRAMFMDMINDVPDDGDLANTLDGIDDVTKEQMKRYRSATEALTAAKKRLSAIDKTLSEFTAKISQQEKNY